MKTLKSACPLDCWDACSFSVEVEEKGDFNVRGDKNHPITQGFLCNKGREYLKERVFSPNRIKTPLLKQGENYIPVSWEQALEIFAQKIKTTLENYGPKGIAHYYDSGAGGLLKSLEHRFFNLLGGVTEPIGSLCWAAGLEGTKEDFGTYYSHHPLDMYNSDCIVIWGRNVTETNIHLLPFIKEALKRGKKLVLIDPNATKISEKATLYLKINPATDGFLALALIKKLMDKGISQKLLRNCNNYNQLKKIVDCYTIERISEITGIPVDQINEFANLYLSGRSTIYLGYGMQRYYNSGNTIRAINSLAYLSGNVGVKGGGVNYADCYVAKNLDINSLTLGNLGERRYFPKPQFAEYLLKEKEPPVKVLYISRANPVVTLPNTNKTLKAFSNIDFVVCCDVLHTDTTKIADLVLPATTSFEEEDLIFTSMWHRYINYLHPVIERQGQCKPEWVIFQELARYLNLPDFPELTASQWLEKALKPMEKYNITLQKLKESSLAPTDEESIPWQDLKFSTPDGKFNLLNEKILLMEENRDFPYLFMTPHPKLSLHSQFQQHLKLGDYPQIFINPKLAEREGLKDGEIVTIESKTGKLKGEITLANWVHKKVLLTYEGRPLNYGNTPNLITDEGLTDIGLGTTMYQTYCRIVKPS